MKVEKTILRIFKEKMSSVFRNYEAFGGLFVVKPATEEGHFPPHQDWSFVNENKFWSINMWCPLEDVNDANGNLIVLKGSHQFYETIRGANTPDIYRDHLKLISTNMSSVPMKAGQAIFFFHGLLHRSTPNITNKPRASIGLTLTPKNSELLFYFFDKDSSAPLIQYKTNPEFYIQYACNRDNKPSIPGQTYQFPFTEINEIDLVNKIKSANNEVKLSVNSIPNTFLKESLLKRIYKSLALK